MNRLAFLVMMSLLLFGKNCLPSAVSKPKTYSLDQKKMDIKSACRVDVSFIMTLPKTGGVVQASQPICRLEKLAVQTVRCFMTLELNMLLIQYLVNKPHIQTVTQDNS